MRLARATFSSKDQLLTLALGANLDEKIFAAAREAGVPTVSHGVNNNTEPTLFALGRAGLLKPGDEYIHCTHMSDAAWKLIKDTGGHVSLERFDRVRGARRVKAAPRRQVHAHEAPRSDRQHQ